MKTVFIINLRSDSEGIEIPATSKYSIRTVIQILLHRKGGRGVLRSEC